jgi:hypothetical protein
MLTVSEWPESLNSRLPYHLSTDQVMLSLYIFRRSILKSSSLKLIQPVAATFSTVDKKGKKAKKANSDVRQFDFCVPNITSRITESNQFACHVIDCYQV